MAKYKRIQVNNAIIDSGLVPVFFNKDIEVAKNVAKAVWEGGSKVLEFTNRGEFAYQIFGELVKFCEKETPGLILGVGSVATLIRLRSSSTTGLTLSLGLCLTPRWPRSPTVKKSPTLRAAVR